MLKGKALQQGLASTRFALVFLASALTAISSNGAESAGEEPSPGVQREERAFALLRGDKTRPADPHAAARLFEVGAQEGRPVSQLALARQYLDGQGVPRDAARSFLLMRDAARQGLADAQSGLGWMFLTGTGTKVDATAAVQWLASSARQGSAGAFALLADMYMRGEGVARDEKIGFDLMRRAAELGDDRAAVRFGSVSMFGPREFRNSALGIHFLEKAALRNNDQAAYVLAQAFLVGASVPRDVVKAAQWMTRAADAKHEIAVLWQSELYAKGMGVPRDPQRAALLLEQGLAGAGVASKNEFAWQLAVNEDAALRNGTLAVKIMEAALGDPAMRKPAYLDTLAAAHAEAGDFKAAVALQMQAIEGLAKQPRTEQLVARMRSRLEDYRAGKAFREERP